MSRAVALSYAFFFMFCRSLCGPNSRHSSARLVVGMAGNAALDADTASGCGGKSQAGTYAAGTKFHDGSTDALVWRGAFDQADAVIFDDELEDLISVVAGDLNCLGTAVAIGVANGFAAYAEKIIRRGFIDEIGGNIAAVKLNVRGFVLELGGIVQ